MSVQQREKYRRIDPTFITCIHNKWLHPLCTCYEVGCESLTITIFLKLSYFPVLRPTNDDDDDDEMMSGRAVSSHADCGSSNKSIKAFDPELQHHSHSSVKSYCRVCERKPLPCVMFILCIKEEILRWCCEKTTCPTKLMSEMQGIQ